VYVPCVYRAGRNLGFALLAVSRWSGRVGVAGDPAMRVFVVFVSCF